MKRLSSLFLALVLFVCTAGAALAQPEVPSTFKPTVSGDKLTPLDRCIKDVERLETDAIGMPYLAAGYIAFFLILVVFFVLAAARQRKLEAEMTELRDRLARLQTGTAP